MIKTGERIHIIGILGSGLSAIARVLRERGFSVSGSDRHMNALAQELEALGIKVYEGHDAANVGDATLVIRSSAIPDQNVEVQAARSKGIPVLKRVDFLRDMIGDQRTIAIAGTHGKTTTTAMTAWVLTAMRLNPSYIIGGISLDLKGNAHAGRGDYFVIEADEYDGMFFGLSPDVAVITNMEYDHPDCYPTRESFKQAFYRFARQVSPQGHLIVCIEDDRTRKLGVDLKRERSIVTYGWGTSEDEPRTDYEAFHLEVAQTGGYRFEAVFRGQPLGKVALQVPGKHNVLNALAVVAICHQLGFDSAEVCKALGEFHGTSRRFEIRGGAGGIVVVDDYAHHPSEIRATIAAAKAKYPQKKIWAVWQPHTFSRTQALWSSFREAFQDADEIVVLDVFAAREEKPQGFSMEALGMDINHPAKRFCRTLEEAREYLLRRLEPESVVLVLSAGDADRLSGEIIADLKGEPIEHGR